MKDYFRKLLRNHYGFSMAQALIGLGVVGGLSLVVAQIGKQSSQNQKAANSSYAVVEATAQIQSLLSNQGACAATFSGLTVAPNTSVAIPILRKPGSTERYEVNQNLANNELQITGMTLRRRDANSLLTVTFRRNASQNGTASTSASISREFFINTIWDSANTVTSCASDVSNFIETVSELALLRACPPINPADPNDTRRFQPDDPSAPTACQAMAQPQDDNNDFRCPPGSSYAGFDWVGGRYHKVCREAINAETCTENQLMHRDANGVLKCVDVSCPVGQLALGVDANGKMVCSGCETGKSPMFTTSGLRCVNPNCTGADEVMIGVGDDGNAVCWKFIDTSACGDGGGRLVQDNNALKIECCQPACNNSQNTCSGQPYVSSNGCGMCTGTRQADCSSAAANYCQGDTFTSPNGCGTCSGTKLPSCADAGNYCVGQSYQSSNGCGSCVGAKQPAAETFAWVDTTTFRAQPGATCIGGVVKRERLRNKVCNGDAVCGGATCSGESAWVEDGTQSCTPACSNGTMIQGAQISHTSNTIYCGNRTGDIWVNKVLECVNGEYKEKTGIQAYRRSQDICDPGTKTVPPSGTEVYYGTTDPCTLGLKNQYTEVTSGYGTFSFCSWRFISGGSSSGGGGGGGCFIAGTQVTLFSGEKKNIEDIVVGDELVDGSKKRVTVQKLIRIHHAGDIVSINGGGYFFTPNHPFLTTAGWKSLDPEASNIETPGLDVKLLQIGDILIKQNGIELVVTMDRTPTNEQVYNFELDGSHEYVADDYVVHNKFMPVEPTDP